GIRDFHVTGVQSCALPILSMPMLAFGVFLARREEASWRGGGLALLGIGLVFLGIDLMKAGFSGFEGAFDLARFAVDGWAGVFLRSEERRGGNGCRERG